MSNETHGVLNFPDEFPEWNCQSTSIPDTTAADEGFDMKYTQLSCVAISIYNQNDLKHLNF